jgi:[NiFe] hydrogenase diaphorase moiety small subunit
MSADSRPTFSLDGRDIPFDPDQTILQAAMAAAFYVPHLCFHEEFKPHGSCKVCTVRVNGRTAASCTTPAREGDEVESEIPEIRELRKDLVQFLFTEGNHFCPSCETSGSCKLQAVAYGLEVTSGYHNPLYPDRPLDASHPDVLLEFNRCILCELCIRASSEIDGKHVFALSGRGIRKHLIVNAESGRLADTTLSVNDKAMNVCPVGVILRKRRGFVVPIGQRKYDAKPLSEVAVAGVESRRREG